MEDLKRVVSFMSERNVRGLHRNKVEEILNNYETEKALKLANKFIDLVEKDRKCPKLDIALPFDEFGYYIHIEDVNRKTNKSLYENGEIVKFPDKEGKCRIVRKTSVNKDKHVSDAGKYGRLLGRYPNVRSETFYKVVYQGDVKEFHI